MIAPNIERRRRIERLREFFRTCSDGEEVLWIRIEEETEIDMSGTHGRALVREALKKEKRPYVAAKGDGVVLSCPSNVIDILNKRVARVASRSGAASVTRAQLLDRHEARLSKDIIDKMSRLAPVFAQLTVLAEEADRLVAARLELHKERAKLRAGEKKPAGL